MTTRIDQTTLLAQEPIVLQALRHAAAQPGRTAVVDNTGEHLGWSALARRSAAVASALRARAIGPGDLVVLAMPNSAWWPVVTLGVWRAGAAVVPISPLWTAAETGRLLAHVRPRAAFASGALVPVVRGALAAAALVAETIVHDVELARAVGCTPVERLLGRFFDDPLAEPELDLSDLAVMLFSSGTEGLPKGVRLTHANLAASAAPTRSVFAASGSFDADSVLFAAAPFFHAMGFAAGLCLALSTGACLVADASPSSERAVEVMAEQRATHALVRPPLVSEVARDDEIVSRELPDLQFVTTGGAHVLAAHQLRAGERLGALVRQAYGTTETLLISGPMGRPSEPETVGWLADGVQARLVDPESGDARAGENSGELLVRGPQVMQGYHHDPEATAAAVDGDGWLRTGDLVTIRDDGQLVVEDRLKELIKVDGRSVAPAELELVLREHPAVRDAAVVGRPHPETGEVPVARVVLARSASPNELLSHVAERVAEYKRLHDVRVVAELPRLPSGKLARRKLRDEERTLELHTEVRHVA
jgi:acyl-CoA synthetase (AMP-forming)/AMP-acid ligase II